MGLHALQAHVLPQHLLLCGIALLATHLCCCLHNVIRCLYQAPQLHWQLQQQPQLPRHLAVLAGRGSRHLAQLQQQLRGKLCLDDGKAILPPGRQQQPAKM
jgi:hypothetical protein